MTRVIVQNEVAQQIRAAEGPIDLVDETGQTIGRVFRPPTNAEIERAKSRTSHGGPTLTWSQLMEKIQAEVDL